MVKDGRRYKIVGDQVDKFLSIKNITSSQKEDNLEPNLISNLPDNEAINDFVSKNPDQKTLINDKPKEFTKKSFFLGYNMTSSKSNSHSNQFKMKSGHGTF